MDEQSLQLNTVSNFGFSAVNVDTLEGSKYCLASLRIDASGSVWQFVKDLEEMGNQVIQSTQKSPEAENVLLQTATFSGRDIHELHGFVPVTTLDADKYTGQINVGSTTPLYDATVDAAESIESYGKQLVDSEYMVNGILFIVTDGEELGSRVVRTVDGVKQAITRIRTNESVESLVTILIGVNDSSCEAALKSYASDAGFDHYISVGEASPSKLAQLGQLISQSISSQSQQIGSGGPSQACNFSI